MLTLTPTTSDASFDALLHEMAETGEVALAGAHIARRLTLLGELGAGGHGRVWEAWDAVLGRRVAVKLMRERSLSQAALREAAMLERLRHPRIVRLHGFGATADGTPYLVMELLAGETLAARVRSDGPLAPAAIGELIAQLADALGEAHAHGVLHRDIKPSNVFLAADGARLIDFGVSRDFDAGGGAAGTPAYMSHEQLANEPLDGRADVFGLAAAAYFALTGRHAFTGAARGAVAPTGLWPAIDGFFARALGLAAQRFSTPRELVLAWRAAMLAQPLAAAELSARFQAAFAAPRPAPADSALDVRWAVAILFVLSLLAAIYTANCSLISAGASDGSGSASS